MCYTRMVGMSLFSVMIGGSMTKTRARCLCAAALLCATLTAAGCAGSTRFKAQELEYERVNPVGALPTLGIP